MSTATLNVESTGTRESRAKRSSHGQEFLLLQYLIRSWPRLSRDLLRRSGSYATPAAPERLTCSPGLREKSDVADAIRAVKKFGYKR